MTWPDELQRCTHVFVKRGGHPTSLTTPYTGPHRVLSRSAHTFRVDIPGKGPEAIAIARLKPACVADDLEESSDEETPPLPPGRRPGPRTRMPEATDRRTRQSQPANERDGTPERPTSSPASKAEVKTEANEDNIHPEQTSAAPLPARRVSIHCQCHS